MLFNKSVKSSARSYNRNRRFDNEDTAPEDFPVVPFVVGVLLFIIVANAISEYNNSNINRLLQIYNGKQLAGIRTSLGKNGRVSSEQIQKIEFNNMQAKAFNLVKDELIVKIVPLIEENTFKY